VGSLGALYQTGLQIHTRRGEASFIRCGLRQTVLSRLTQELALLYGARRMATVTCHTGVELLTVSRSDYINIFALLDCQSTEPESVSFLRSVAVLDGWPVDVLPYNKPNVCTAVFFRLLRIYCSSTGFAFLPNPARTGENMTHTRSPTHTTSTLRNFT